MFLKIMGGENVPDGNVSKTFQLLGDLQSVSFRRFEKADGIHEAGSAEAIVWRRDQGCEFHPLPGNAYVLNDDGKTIESFTPTPYREAA